MDCATKRRCDTLGPLVIDMRRATTTLRAQIGRGDIGARPRRCCATSRPRNHRGTAERGRSEAGVNCYKIAAHARMLRCLVQARRSRMTRFPTSRFLFDWNKHLDFRSTRKTARGHCITETLP